ncbi:zinc finger protein CONSTANS-like [Salvia miltiorrhiza]|uniref:zinc finger protein CONSTANS-like n=1 Tax=Salvia miltiorrhiza TaxID=226208 RepID=UPI0025AD9149|nr:zinc finger protein CONSTANS-like [Salvia miltiorrhiza]
MKKCELCNKVARMYCESDEATLCWGCDLRVHTANFIVAKHTRTLLCHACQSPTPWTGSGPKLGPTVSVCEACVNGRARDGDDEDEENGDLALDDDDDSENQVVPLSLPPSLASASTSSCTTRDALSTPTTSYDVSQSSEDKSGAKKMRSWMWR